MRISPNGQAFPTSLSLQAQSKPYITPMLGLGKPPRLVKGCGARAPALPKILPTLNPLTAPLWECIVIGRMRPPRASVRQDVAPLN